MADPFFSNVQLLVCNDNAANTNTTFNDQSNAHRAVSRVSTPTYSNAQAPANMTTSGNFSTAGFGLSVASNVSLEFGSGDWTFEAFIYRAANSVNDHYLLRKGNAFSIFGGTGPNAPGGYGLTMSSDGVNSDISDGDVRTDAQLTSGVWNYIAFKRSGTSLSAAWGTTQGSATTAGQGITSALTVVSNASALLVADGAGGNDDSGFLSSTRLTIGVARDISIVPTLPFQLGASGSIFRSASMNLNGLGGGGKFYRNPLG